MKTITVVLSVTVLLLNMSSVIAQAEKKWEIKNVYKAPESVAYDVKRDVIYISNYTEQMKNGSFYANHCISKAKTDGELIEFDWISGVTCPTGIIINKDKLYITERFGVVEVDLDKGEVSNRYMIKTTGFLNDITGDKNGDIYISVSDSNIIYRIKEGKVDVWFENKEISHANGIMVDNDKLIIGVNSDGYLKSIDLETQQIEKIAFVGDENIDGIKKCNTGYLITLFSGKLIHVSPVGEVEIILDTTTEGINMADFEYIEEKNLVILPALWNNILMGYDYVSKK